MTDDLEFMTAEDLLSYIQSFIASSKKPLDFGIYYDQGTWKTYVTTYPQIIETNLRDALYWLCMHLKNDVRYDDLSYK